MQNENPEINGKKGKGSNNQNSSSKSPPMPKLFSIKKISNTKSVFKNSNNKDLKTIKSSIFWTNKNEDESKDENDYENDDSCINRLGIKSTMSKNKNEDENENKNDFYYDDSCINRLGVKGSMFKNRNKKENNYDDSYINRPGIKNTMFKNKPKNNQFLSDTKENTPENINSYDSLNFTIDSKDDHSVKIPKKSIFFKNFNDEKESINTTRNELISKNTYSSNYEPRYNSQNFLNNKNPNQTNFGSTTHYSQNFLETKNTKCLFNNSKTIIDNKIYPKNTPKIPNNSLTNSIYINDNEKSCNSSNIGPSFHSEKFIDKDPNPNSETFLYSFSSSCNSTKYFPNQFLINYEYYKNIKIKKNNQHDLYPNNSFFCGKSDCKNNIFVDNNDIKNENVNNSDFLDHHRYCDNIRSYNECCNDNSREFNTNNNFVKSGYKTENNVGLDTKSTKNVEFLNLYGMNQNKLQKGKYNFENTENILSNTKNILTNSENILSKSENINENILTNSKNTLTNKNIGENTENILLAKSENILANSKKFLTNENIHENIENLLANYENIHEKINENILKIPKIKSLSEILIFQTLKTFRPIQISPNQNHQIKFRGMKHQKNKIPL